MNAIFFYGKARKKAELALPLDDSEDEKGFSDEENEMLETQQSESDEDWMMDDGEESPKEEGKTVPAY